MRVLSPARAAEGRTPGADSRPLSVVHVVLSLAPGGAERMVVQLVTRSEGAIRNAVCCLDEAGEWAADLRARGVPVTVLGRRPGFHPVHALQIARVTDRHAADVLHCHQFSPFVYSQIAHLCRPALRLVFTEHGRLADAAPSRKRALVNQLLRRVPVTMVAVSDDLKRHMVDEGLCAADIAVVRNGVEAGARPADGARRRARQTLGLPEDAYVIGTAARFDPVKSLDTLVDAFAEVAARVPAAALVLIGDGPLRDPLQRLVEARGLTARTRFTGMRADVRALLPGLDLFANSSTSEGTSVTLMEAMAAALPIVATRAGGNPEVVQEWVTGLLVPARSPLALARALTAVAANPAWGVEMGCAGRTRMEAEFSIERVVERYLRIYRGGEAA